MNTQKTISDRKVEVLVPATIPHIERGSTFCSRIFDVLVGPSKRTFKVHESILSQSPVLDRMCNGGFQENINSCIELPEDDADAFADVLAFLYAGNFELPRSTPSLCISRITLIYILAEKYQLEKLKILCVRKLEHEVLIANDLDPMICVAAQQIYEHTTKLDAPFRPFFRGKMMSMINRDPFKAKEVFEEIARCGGDLAVDCLNCFGNVAWAYQLHITRK